MNSIEVKYQLFISSTYEDLKEERRGVIETILKYRHFPIGMEMFNANNKEQWEIIKNTIDSSNIYILILGHRYGSLTNDKKRISFTEKEFRYALKRRRQGKLQLLCFIKDNKVATEPEKMEQEPYGIEELKRFKNDVKDSKLIVEFWKNTDDLKSKVGSAVADTVLDLNLLNHSKIGWIKRESVENEIQPIKEINLLSHLPHITNLLKTIALNYTTINEETQYYDFDDKGHCEITKDRTQFCNCDVSHNMTQYIADKGGNSKIISIIDLNSNNNSDFQAIPFVHNSTELRFFIFYGKIIPKDSEVRYREKVKIENFLSNLMDFKIGRIRNKSNPNTSFSKKSDVFSFPNTDKFKNLSVILQQIYPNQTLNKIIEHEIIKNKKVFKINYGMVNVGNDVIIQFEL